MKKSGTLLWILAALAALGLAGQRHVPLNRLRNSLWPEAARQALRDAPPLVVFTSVALGGFQGLIADLLWLRVARLQEQGHYFEIVQLSDWITKLEPRFSEVWAFHAWNMAYNISVMFPDPDDRWRWVQHGIRLLRDEGLRYNPADPRLYHELGWIYQHKIGQHYDDAHMAYKWELAQIMEAVIEGGQLDAGRLSNDRELRQRLRLDYGLDPDAMLAVDRSYGPLDWRSAHTHAVYWAWHGLRVAPSHGSLPNERLLFHGLGQAFQQGRIILDMERRALLASPDLERFPAARDAFQSAIQRHPDETTIQTAYRNFLSDAMTVFFLYNRRSEAQAVLDKLRAEFPATAYPEDLEQAVMGDLLAEMEQSSLRQAVAMIEGFFFQGAVFRALGESERADALDRLAVFIRQRVARRFGDRAPANLPSAQALQSMAIERARATHAILFNSGSRESSP